MTAPERRTILKALTASLAALTSDGLAAPTAAATKTAAAAAECWPVQTLLAFADTLIPGERRFPGDTVVAGAVTGPGAVQAGAADILASPQLPVAPLLPLIASLLDARAVTYAAIRLIWLPPLQPPFTGLSFHHRTALVKGLFGPDDPDRPIWQMLSLLIGLAFDTAGSDDTSQAVTRKHPGLTWLGFPSPDTDGRWRFTEFSYGRPLAALHPRTTPSGSPA
ncbi:DUF5987 family protein [Streptomyces sp. NPDC085614]|uniref:DUF5987 family protein n=1 Tax=Streptomyces sp. NPDC085614 TaxID=3365733 RepID=UPI0037D3074E